MKVTADGISGDGKPTHIEWTGRFDGKDYPVTGDPNSDMRSYKKVDDHKLELTVKKVAKLPPPVASLSRLMAKAAL